MTDTNRRAFLQQTAGAVAAFSLQPDLSTLAQPFNANRKALQVGVIGAGKQGRAILGEIQKIDGATVTGICDVLESRRRGGVRRARDAEQFDDYRRMLDKQDINAVVIATPTHLHKNIALDAIAAGRHVYCEAPLASTIADARAIADAAAQHNKTFQVGMQARSNPIYKLARSFYRSGAVRDLISLRSQDHRKTSWRIPSDNPEREKALNWRLDQTRSIGLPGELGTQQFDAMHWFVGNYPTSVRGSGGIMLYKDGRDVPDTVQCDLAFDKGVTLSWRATLATSYEGRYELYSGSMASIKLAWTAGWMFKEADAPTQGWEVYANRESFHDDEGITLIADATKLAKQGKLLDGVGLPHAPLYYALADFVDSATRGKPPTCTAEEGMRAAIVGIRAHEAVMTGEEIAIDPALLEVR